MYNNVETRLLGRPSLFVNIADTSGPSQIFNILYSLKFIYSEKATKFCEISTVDLSYIVPVKSTVEISQNFVAFSEYRNFNYVDKTR